MTLPGIAGMILTIGVAADANVVIFERIKEEVRAGKTVRAAISAGYSKGFQHDRRRQRGHADHGGGAVRRRRRRPSRASPSCWPSASWSRCSRPWPRTRAMLGILGNFKWFNNVAFMGADAEARALDAWTSPAARCCGSRSPASRSSSASARWPSTGSTRASTSRAAPASTSRCEQPADAGRRARRAGGRRLRPARRRHPRARHDRQDQNTFTEFQVDAEGDPDRGRGGLHAGAARAATGWRTQPDVRIGVGVVRLGDPARRDPGVHLLDVPDRRLHRVPLRLALRGADDRGPDPRPDHHVGVYSLFDREVSSATVAAVLTVLGYSLYDTIIIFDRVRENEAHAAQAHLRRDREHLAVGDADALAEHVVHHAAADPARCSSSAARRCRTSRSRCSSASRPAPTRPSSSPPAAGVHQGPPARVQQAHGLQRAAVVPAAARPPRPRGRAGRRRRGAAATATATAAPTAVAEAERPPPPAAVTDDGAPASPRRRSTTPRREARAAARARRADRKSRRRPHGRTVDAARRERAPSDPLPSLSGPCCPASPSPPRPWTRWRGCARRSTSRG